MFITTRIIPASIILIFLLNLLPEYYTFFTGAEKSDMTDIVQNKRVEMKKEDSDKR